MCVCVCLFFHKKSMGRVFAPFRYVQAAKVRRGWKFTKLRRLAPKARTCDKTCAQSEESEERNACEAGLRRNWFKETGVMERVSDGSNALQWSFTPGRAQ